MDFHRVVNREVLFAGEDDPTGRYWDIIVYDHQLTGKELIDYELDELGRVDY